MDMKGFIRDAKVILISLSILGVAIYGITMLAYLFKFSPAVALLDSAARSYTFGLPICAAIAFAIVAILDTVSPAKSDGSGKLEFKAFGLTFSGPAGPTTLWIVVYLTLVASIQIVK